MVSITKYFSGFFNPQFKRDIFQVLVNFTNYSHIKNFCNYAVLDLKVWKSSWFTFFFTKKPFPSKNSNYISFPSHLKTLHFSPIKSHEFLQSILLLFSQCCQLCHQIWYFFIHPIYVGKLNWLSSVTILEIRFRVSRKLLNKFYLKLVTLLSLRKWLEVR